MRVGDRLRQMSSDWVYLGATVIIRVLAYKSFGGNVYYLYLSSIAE